jgi:hypothetical protein
VNKSFFFVLPIILVLSLPVFAEDELWVPVELTKPVFVPISQRPLVPLPEQKYPAMMRVTSELQAEIKLLDGRVLHVDSKPDFLNRTLGAEGYVIPSEIVNSVPGLRRRMVDFSKDIDPDMSTKLAALPVIPITIGPIVGSSQIELDSKNDPNANPLH